jgi:hypothetical protein
MPRESSALFQPGIVSSFHFLKRRCSNTMQVLQVGLELSPSGGITMLEPKICPAQPVFFLVKTAFKKSDALKKRFGCGEMR